MTLQSRMQSFARSFLGSLGEALGPQGGVRLLLGSQASPTVKLLPRSHQASPTVRLLSNSCWSVVKPVKKPVVRLFSSSCCMGEKLYSKKHEWVEVVQGQGEVRQYGWNT